MSFRVGEFTREGEKEFVIGSKDWGRVNIHPWDRTSEGGYREVAVTVGKLSKRGYYDDSSDAHEITIVDRDKFIEGLLEVFPELTRTSENPKFAAGGYITTQIPWGPTGEAMATLLKDLGITR